MPSPLAHTVAGYAVYRLLRAPNTSEPRLLLAAVTFSLLPDLDALVGLAGRDFGRYHNNVSHSVGFAAGAGILAGFLMGRRQGEFWRWFSAGFLAYGLHLGLDYWATRRGLLMLWPLSSRRFSSPKKLFYGFQWGRGICSATHIWTAVTELLSALALVSAVRWFRTRLKA